MSCENGLLPTLVIWLKGDVHNGKPSTWVRWYSGSASSHSAATDYPVTFCKASPLRDQFLKVCWHRAFVAKVLLYTLLEMKLASPKNKPTSYPMSWRKNIFRNNDSPKGEKYSPFLVSMAIASKVSIFEPVVLRKKTSVALKQTSFLSVCTDFAGLSSRALTKSKLKCGGWNPGWENPRNVLRDDDEGFLKKKT